MLQRFPVARPPLQLVINECSTAFAAQHLIWTNSWAPDAQLQGSAPYIRTHHATTAITCCSSEVRINKKAQMCTVEQRQWEF